MVSLDTELDVEVEVTCTLLIICLEAETSFKKGNLIEIFPRLVVGAALPVILLIILICSFLNVSHRFWHLVFACAPEMNIEIKLLYKIVTSM